MPGGPRNLNCVKYWNGICDALTTKVLPTRHPETVTRFISLVNGEHLITPLPESVALEKLVYVQDTQGLRMTDGSKWGVHLSTLSLQ